MSDLLDLLIAGVMFVPMVVASVFIGCGLLSGSHRRWTRPPEIVFSPSPSLAVGLAMMPFSIAWACVIQANLPGLFGVIGRISFWTQPKAVEVFLGLPPLVAAACWLAVQWSRWQFSLVLNRSQKTYRFMRRTGTWDDIAGIVIAVIEGESGVTYCVQLKWRGPVRICPILGSFGQPDDAEAFAAQMAWESGLPLLTA